ADLIDDVDRVPVRVVVLDVVVVVQEQDGVWIVLSCPAEGLYDLVVAVRARASEGVHVGGRRVGRRLVDDVDDRHVRIALAEQPNPLLDLTPLLACWEVRDSVRLLSTPHQNVSLVGNAVLARIVPDAVQDYTRQNDIPYKGHT